MEPARPAMLVDELERAGLDLEQPRQLRGGAAQRIGRRSEVHLVGREYVEGLGEDGGEILVLGADDDPTAVTARLPEETGDLGRHDRSADLQRQLQAEPE